MRIFATLAAGALLTLGGFAGTTQAAPLSHTIASSADANAALVEKAHHRHWHRGGHGRRYGWYGPPRYRDYGYYRPRARYYYGPPRYRDYGYYRPRPRAGIYFGFGSPGFGFGSPGYW